jgi:hypothetical protein
MTEVYFFGCANHPGHFLWRSGSNHTLWDVPADWPWKGVCGLDRKYPPQNGSQPLGQATLTNHQGWTVLAMWDRSVDTRLNSNAAFIARGEHDFAAMMDLAREHFPRVLARIEAQAPLVEVRPQQGRVT